jgi:uncharacterized protein (TIGR03437 family)
MQQTRSKTYRLSVRAATYLFILGILLGLAPHKVLAQRNRITVTIDNSRRITLPGHIHPGVVPANDQGRADSSLQLPYVTVALQPSAAQQADLTALLQRQQDPSSPDFHRWLTPEQYADRFGLAQSDVDKITAWMQTQGLTVLSVARGRNAISFSGPVRSVEGAFGTEIHHYLVNGELHFANATNPSIPAAFGDVVLGIHGLNDFKMKPAIRQRSVVALPSAARPAYTNAVCSPGLCLAPADFATIYDVNPLYNSGITGTGQTLVIVGQTEINPLDISSFRSAFNLPANAPAMVPVPNTNPGVSTADLPEADLDLELSGAVAPNATVVYVYSNDVEVSVEYAIDQYCPAGSNCIGQTVPPLGPVVSMSYGQCEEPASADGGQTSADALTMRGFAQQANAKGMTWFAAAGDSGAADCVGEGLSLSLTDSATVDYPGSIPEVTSVGGLEFNEGSTPSVTFWNSSGAATRYIPEMVWNDSVNDGTPSAGGGGASIYFSKPSWQVATGVPNDGKRDVPDVSLSASADHDGYLIYSSNYGRRNGFGTSQPTVVGGTSAGAPSMAGIVTLLNQYLVQNGFQSQPGLGNINPRLYALQNAANVFHDITVGNNIVNPCEGTNETCTNTSVGFSAGPGYDLASGLGSMDVYNMVLAWHQSGTSSKVSPTLTLISNTSTLAAGGSATLTATLTVSNGGTPTGTVTFSDGGVALETVTVSGGTASLTVNSFQLSAGTNTITAQYSGDGNYNAATSAAVTITIPVSTAPAITGVTNAASFKQVYAPGMILAVFGSNLGPATPALAPSVPLPTSLGGVTVTINGVAAPLYYVSSGQLNVQIPYATTVNATATLTVSYGGQSASISFLVSAAAPGIFYDPNSGDVVPYESAAPGATITLYITGDGAQSPAATTGSTPAPNVVPKPTQNVAMTVGGTAVNLQCPTCFVGTPSWSVGVTQINFQVPASAIPGAPLEIVVTVGGVQSASVNLNIN